MWYFVWILGLFLASAFSVLNVISLEKGDSETES
ncbi:MULTISPECIES: cytochrome bd-I oxidase subunit CydX [Vibrio]|uniref:Cyd operon protein YbgT n=1 Tax=Vibrio lentus TaxID=136468 RepID=A0A2N7IJF4_9VIBR|nr:MULTISPECIES: cytochrome bd-I oxidase subunit CydX [Vibrio]PHX04903.1 Membrane bound YbgT-like protein [Vibrio splendidus]PML57890.1 cyd operon protein YbgT [Vibrio lentus]PMM38256.1 cyd operon protein YbgT [Vibrio lentus]PTP92238.1 cytochrome bd-I oxidase subunit CydX [Vibrio splendidus]